MIPLIILDLDGTIIGSRGHVEDCVWRAVDKAKEAGIKFAVCTGRPCFGVAQRVAKRLGETNPHVFQSGAHIAYPDGEVVKVFALKEAVTKQLINKARALDAVLEVYTPTTLYVERKTDISEAHAKMIGVNAIVSDLSEVAANEPIIRAQWVVTPEQKDLVLEEDLAGVQVSPATSPAQKGVFFISITAQSVSKGSAVTLLAEAMRTDLQETLAVGDSMGDLSMLEAVGYPVVMENATEALKSRFDRVAGRVDDCGIVETIEGAIKGR